MVIQSNTKGALNNFHCHVFKLFLCFRLAYIYLIFHNVGAVQTCKIYVNCPMMENLWINNRVVTTSGF